MNRDDMPPEDKLVRLAYLALLVANSLKSGQPEAAEGALMMICLEGAIYLTEPPPAWTRGIIQQCAVNLLASREPQPPKDRPS